MNDNQPTTATDTALMEAIVKELTAEMLRRIENIDPHDDSSAEYGEYWERGSYSSDDGLYLDGEFSGYEIGYEYELSWRYREWTEYWTDPVCYPSFDEMDSEKGEVYNIVVIDPDGNELPEEFCKEIAKQVNEQIG